MPVIKLQGDWIYRVKHQRLYRGDPDPLPHGGKTVVEVGYLTEHANGEREFHVVSTGVARCSEKDGYNRKRGRDIALGRALKALEK